MRERNNTAKGFDISQKNWSNQNLFPKELFIDTNSIINAFTKRNNGTMIEKYLDELKRRGGSLFIYSKIEEELYDFFHTDEYISKAKKEGFYNNGRPNWKYAENILDNSEAKVISQNTLTRTNSALSFVESKNGIFLPIEEKEYKKISIEIYRNFGGNRKDAEHVAVANQFGINNFITQDTSNGNGFFRYPNINIFGNSKPIIDNYQSNIIPNNYIDIEEILITDNN